MKQIRLERTDEMLKKLANYGVTLTGTATVQHIRDKHTAKGNTFRTICLIDIRFVFNNKEYVLDHTWLQQQDYPAYFRRVAKENKEYRFDFVFYPYRHKVADNKCGITVTKIYK